MLSAEQAKQIKEQLLKQIESWPEEQREGAKEEIESMNEEELEHFLAKNNLMKQGKAAEDQQCVFCLIIEGKVPAYKIDENKENLALLEINPASKGHCLIVPKKHFPSDKLSSSSFSLAKKISKKLMNKFKPKRVDILTSEFLGHSLINVLPIYNQENLFTERKKAPEAEMKELQEKLQTKKHEKVFKVKTEKSSKPLPKAPRRIP